MHVEESIELMYRYWNKLFYAIGEGRVIDYEAMNQMDVYEFFRTKLTWKEVTERKIEALKGTSTRIKGYRNSA